MSAKKKVFVMVYTMMTYNLMNLAYFIAQTLDTFFPLFIHVHHQITLKGDLMLLENVT